MPQPIPTSPPQSPISIDEQYHELSGRIAALQRRCRQGLCCETLLQCVTDALGSLPLSTEEYGRAICRIRNARRYLIARETGAAAFELRLLADLR